MSEMEMAEIKTVRKIIATMDVIVARAKAEFRQHARDINHSSEIVMARTQQLDKKKIGLVGPGSGWKEAKTRP